MFTTKNLKFLKLKKNELKLEKGELDALFAIYYSPSYTARLSLKYFTGFVERILDPCCDRKIRDKVLLQYINSVVSLSLDDDFRNVREFQSLVDRGLITARIREVENGNKFSFNWIKVDLSIKKNKLGKVICLLVAYAWEKEHADICGEVKKLMDLSIVSR